MVWTVRMDEIYLYGREHVGVNIVAHVYQAKISNKINYY